MQVDYVSSHDISRTCIVKVTVFGCIFATVVSLTWQINAKWWTTWSHSDHRRQLSIKIPLTSFKAPPLLPGPAGECGAVGDPPPPSRARSLTAWVAPGAWRLPPPAPAAAACLRPRWEGWQPEGRRADRAAAQPVDTSPSARPGAAETPGDDGALQKKGQMRSHMWSQEDRSAREMNDKG